MKLEVLFDLTDVILYYESSVQLNLVTRFQRIISSGSSLTVRLVEKQKLVRNKPTRVIRGFFPVAQA